MGAERGTGPGVQVASGHSGKAALSWGSPHVNPHTPQVPCTGGADSWVLGPWAGLGKRTAQGPPFQAHVWSPCCSWGSPTVGGWRAHLPRSPHRYANNQNAFLLPGMLVFWLQGKIFFSSP